MSGALDRLQGEYDPPCKYMSDKKMWRYLHMGRSEEEFMRKHNEKMCGHKLPKDKKAEKRKKTAVETAAVDLPSQEELMQVSTVSNLFYINHFYDLRCLKYPRRFSPILRLISATQTETSFVTFVPLQKMEDHMFPFFGFVPSPLRY